MKKILILIICLSIFGCTNASEKNRQYIKPLNEVALFDNLSSSLKEEFKRINDGKTVDDYVLNDIGIELEDYEIRDYYGNTINLKDYKDGKLILEVVAYWCPHCKQQTKDTEEILKNNPDINFVQFFKDGDKELIDEFYNEAGYEVPNITIIPENNDFTKYLLSEFNPQYMPSFFFFNDGKLTYIKIASLSNDDFNLMYDFVFGDNCLNREKLVDENNESIFKNVFAYDDVLNQINTDNKNKLALIRNSEELTVSIIGKEFNVFDVYDQEGNPLYKLDNYSEFNDKPLAIFYVGNTSGNIDKEIGIINQFIEMHKNITTLTILVDSKDLSTSDLYAVASEKINGVVVSSNSLIPKTLIDTMIYEYPAVLFVQDNIFTGGFYGFENVEELSRAYNTFMGDESIALAKNNSE